MILHWNLRFHRQPTLSQKKIYKKFKKIVLTCQLLSPFYLKKPAGGSLGGSPDDFRLDVVAEPHGISLAFMSIAIVVFGLGCWLHYSPVNRSLASRLHVARIPRIDSLTSSIEAEWFQIEFEFDSDGNSQPLYVYIDRVKRQRFFASLNLIKKRVHSSFDLGSGFFWQLSTNVLMYQKKEKL